VLFLSFGITIAAVTVLAIHKRLRPSVAPDCNYNSIDDWFPTCQIPEMYPIGTLQTLSTPVFPFEVILECRLARAEDGTTMFVILWEFEVKPGSEDRFQKAYGPEGDWVRLFRGDPHFRGTQLLRDSSRALWYFTIDLWDSEADYLAFLDGHRTAYEDLDHAAEGLTFRERRVLSFTLDLPASSSI